MYYFVFVYSAEMGKFHFLVELQAPLLSFTGPNMHGCRRRGALSDFNTSFFANLNWFSSLLPGGPWGCRSGVVHTYSFWGHPDCWCFQGRPRGLRVGFLGILSGREAWTGRKVHCQLCWWPAGSSALWPPLCSFL